MEFSKRLLNFRAKYRLSQFQLSELLGINSNMIPRYEKGQAKPRSANLIRYNKIMEDYEERKGE